MKYLFSTIFILLFTVSISAQSLGSITYNVSVATDRLNNYTDGVSWRGVGLEGRWFTNKNISFGLSFGWNVFAERTNEMINLEQGNIHADISGTQIRTVNALPIMANAHYYLGKRRDPLRFYVGAGAGVYYIKQRLEIGVVAFESNNWHFGLAPEAGILIGLSRDVTMIVNTKYNYAFSSGESLGGGDDNTYAYWGINIGFAWQSF